MRPIFLTPPPARDDPILPWLRLTSSLTARLEQLSGQRLYVMPTYEGRTRLDRRQQQWLGLHPARPQLAWRRDAKLYPSAAAEPWVMANSWFPFSSLSADGRRLTRLGNTPIGYVLFARGGARLSRRWVRQTASGWQRISRYDWQQRPLLICETFLPSFVDTITTTPMQIANLNPD